MDKLSTALYASFTRDDYNFTNFSQNDATGVFTAGKMNLKLVRALGGDISVPFDITKFWSLNASVDATYFRYQDYAGQLNKGTADATLKLDQQFQLPAGLSFNLYGFYETSNFYYIYQYKSSYYLNTGIQKSLLNKMATLSFTATDLFNSNRDRYNSSYANLNLTGFDKKETRIFKLTFTYKFGKNMSSRKHVTGNSDGLNRLIVN